MCESSQSGRLQVTAEEIPDALPGVHGRFGTVAGPVHLQEGVPGAVVGVELVRLAVRLERLLELGDLIRRRMRVLPAEQAEQRAGQVTRPIDQRRNAVQRMSLRRRVDDGA